MPKYDPVARMQELMKPIDQQIMMCDNVEDILALASVMATTAKNMYVSVLGRDGAKHILETLVGTIYDER
jgi:hypothetical protein